MAVDFTYKVKNGLKGLASLISCFLSRLLRVDGSCDDGALVLVEVTMSVLKGSLPGTVVLHTDLSAVDSCGLVVHNSGIVNQCISNVRHNVTSFLPGLPDVNFMSIGP